MCCCSGAGCGSLVVIVVGSWMAVLLEPAPLPFGKDLPHDMIQGLGLWPRCPPGRSPHARAGNVTVVSPVDGERGFLFGLRESVRRAGWDLRLPGHGRQWVSTAESTRLVLDELKSLDPCAVVLVMDGFDTVIQRPETLAEILPPSGKVLAASAFLTAESDWRVRRLAQLVYGSSQGGTLLNNGVLLGRVADVGRLCEASDFLTRRFDVSSNQWGLNVMAGGAGPAFRALAKELIQVDNARLLQTAHFVRRGWALVIHYPMRGNLLPVLAELGIYPPPEWEPPLDYSSALALDEYRQRIALRFAAMHCHRSWLICLQCQVLVRAQATRRQCGSMTGYAATGNIPHQGFPASTRTNLSHLGVDSADMREPARQAVGPCG